MAKASKPKTAPAADESTAEDKALASLETFLKANGVTDLDDPDQVQHFQQTLEDHRKLAADSHK